MKKKKRTGEEGNGRETYQFAFSSIVFLEHLDKRVLGQAVFADGREVGRLPS